LAKKLCVILGAGASYDCVGEATSLVNWEYRPPVTDEIFEARAAFSPILEHYPKALSLASMLRRAVQRDGLEAALRGLADSSDSHIQRQFRQIPLYLRELLGEVGAHFTNAPANYQYLVNRLLSDDFERVAFVTLNYDLLLDRCIETAASHTFATMDDYLPPGANWLLVKLHGSVNWGYRLVDVKYVGVDRPSVLKLIDEIDLAEHVASEAEVLEGHQHAWKNKGQVTDNYFPAIAVPVDNKYEPVCPSGHWEALQKFIAECPNYLIVGTSAKDEDLLSLLRGRLQVSKSVCCVVGKDVEDATETYFRLTKSTTIWDAHPLVGDFTEFVSSGSLDAFLESLK
jgi:hypothetical protein